MGHCGAIGIRNLDGNHRGNHPMRLTYKDIAAMVKNGKRAIDIAKETGVPAHRVYKRIEYAKEKGLLPRKPSCYVKPRTTGSFASALDRIGDDGILWLKMTYPEQTLEDAFVDLVMRGVSGAD